MKKKSTSLKPTDLVVLASVVIIGCAVYFILLPQINSLHSNYSRQAAKKAEFESLETRFNSLQEVIQLLPNYDRQIDRLTVAYPQGEQSAEAMVQTQTMAERAGLALVSLTPNQSKDGVLPINLSAKGSYEAMNAFMKELKANVRPVAVRSFSLVTESDKQRGTLNASFTLDFPFNPIPEEVVTAAADGSVVVPGQVDLNAPISQ